MRSAPYIAIIILAATIVPGHGGTLYPWCTSGAGMEFGAINCGFTTFEQCLQTARGNGQHCQPNPLYQGSIQSPGKSNKRAARPNMN